jgi:hypothetical protein
LVLWHACHILLRREIEQRSGMDEQVQSDARSIVGLCLEAGDKIEYLNWVCHRGQTCVSR